MSKHYLGTRTCPVCGLTSSFHLSLWTYHQYEHFSEAEKDRIRKAIHDAAEKREAAKPKPTEAETAELFRKMNLGE